VPLPDFQRVIYGRQPLEVVICQVRFPAILKIDTELPAAFQEAIRATFPVLTEKSAAESALPPQIANSLPRQIAQELNALGALGGKKAYAFATTDDAWKVTLERDSLALTTTAYTEWPEFLGHLRTAIGALATTYDPAHFTRVGLRYRDLICRADLGLGDASWGELLQPHIAGALGTEAIGSDITADYGQLVFELPELRGQVLLRHGFAEKEGTDEQCYVIDADYFSQERTEVTDVWGLLEGLHGQAGRLFRWCIQDRLHDALDPRVPV